MLTSRTSVPAARGAGAASSRALSARITRPPQASGAKISKTDRSKQTDVAASTPASSSSENTPRAQRTIATALRCSIATPFGRPVEPEV